MPPRGDAEDINPLYHIVNPSTIKNTAKSNPFLVGSAFFQPLGKRILTQFAINFEFGVRRRSSSLLVESMASTTSIDAKADEVTGQILESGALDGAAIASGAALLLLTGSLAVVFVSVRRRRA